MPYRDPKQPLTTEPEITVATYDAPHEAHLAILHLDTLGISARMLNDLVVGMAPHLGAGSGGIRVLVRQPDAAEAHAALEKLRRELAAERGVRARRAARARKESEPLRPHARWPVWALLAFVLGAWLLHYALQQS